MPSPSPRVTVVIPNWNGLSHLPECLAALAEQTLTDSKVILVDNGSDDDGVAWVRAHHPEVGLIEFPDNAGFAAAANAGIRAARGEYVALLNNDTAVDPGWLAALVEGLETHPGFDFAASRMVFYDDPLRVNAAGDVYRVTRLAGANRGFGKPVDRYLAVERVLGACAGAALYRRSLFDDIGLFDEDFFLMSEDTDFNLRCLIAGRRCLYVPGAVVRHKFRASIDRGPRWEMTRLAVRNEALVVAKDLPVAVLSLVPFLWLWRSLRQTFPVRPSKWHLVPMLVRHSRGRVAAEVEGARAGWSRRPGVWRLRSVGTGELLRWLVKGSQPMGGEGEGGSTARDGADDKVSGRTCSGPAGAGASATVGGRPVDVVIVAHDAGELLIEAVAAAEEQAGAGHVWVVDAASGDGSVEAMGRRYPEVHVVPVANDGFAAAGNRGLALTQAPFVLLLNPDAVLRPGALGALVATAAANPDAGVVGPLVLDPDEEVQRGSYGRFPTLWTTAVSRLQAVGRRLKGAGGSSRQAPPHTVRVDWVTGAAMLVRRAAVEAVGPMDEAFFLYYEDVEWCHRMRDRGWQVVLEPAARVVHRRGGSRAPAGVVERAYRESFYRYCDLYGLHGLKAAARLGLAMRRRLGGRP